MEIVGRARDEHLEREAAGASSRGETGRVGDTSRLLLNLKHLFSRREIPRPG